jgi:16S rRNA (adenine1518-N6/adenine1519-N6)-dimethyltransferase
MTPSLKPLKRFGQHFLVDQNIIRKIKSSVVVGPDDHVLEIGPGRGALTHLLAQVARCVTAVEIDRGWARALEQEAKADGRIHVVCADFLKWDLRAYARRRKIASFVVVANIPYYITTPILEKLFGHIDLLKDVYLMVQKEVARRMMATAGTKVYSAFTCFVNYYCEPAILFGIKPGSFRPSPKVDSCFVRLRPRTRETREADVSSPEGLFRIIRAAFGQRRKRLLASLARVLPREFMLSLGDEFDLKRRAEDVSLQEYKRLANLAFDNKGKG